MEMTFTPDLSIAAVERETGLSKDVLRKWETRYGFPAPLRDSQGERLYPPDQVNRLRLIKRLLDAGMRPSHLITETEASLEAMVLSSHAERSMGKLERTDDIESRILVLLRNQAPDELRQFLYRELLRHGIEHFVLDILTRLNEAVGEAWATGTLDIHEEHVYTEAVQWLLRNAIANLSNANGNPRVLLTTLPEEQHGLGILMTAALFSLHGAHCVSLGTQTPVLDIARAAKAHKVDLVLLSFSIAYTQRRILPALEELRQQIGDDTQIWAGGAGTARIHVAAKETEFLFLPEMAQALSALENWKLMNSSR
jgi:DNA-binding transcriptional MerR regulator/methylmalonyl-CoA mutase cobalamin-binding subunit